MKKFLFCCLIVIGMASAFADSTADIQFKQYVEMTRNNKTNPPGMTVSSDAKYRILYAAMPIAVNKSAITPDIVRQMKAGMITEMAKLEADCKIIKDLKITMIYTFITTDKYSIVIPISYKDF